MKVTGMIHNARASFTVVATSKRVPHICWLPQLQNWYHELQWHTINQTGFEISLNNDLLEGK